MGTVQDHDGRGSDAALQLVPKSGARPTVAAQARGLALARRIEVTADRLRVVARRVKKSAHPKRHKTRRHLRSLKALLQDLERDALSAGVSEAYLVRLVEGLDAVDAPLQRTLDRAQLKGKHLRQLRDDCRAARRQLEGLLEG